MDSVGDLERLARSFERHLRSENKSPRWGVVCRDCYLLVTGTGPASRLTRTLGPRSTPR